MKIIIIGIVLIINTAFLALIIWTILAFYSMFKKHKMKDIEYTPDELDYYPTSEWKYSSPEKQGMNSIKLLEMLNKYKDISEKDKDVFIDTITIIRNQRIVTDMYFNPLFPKDTKHVINSCTKSIISALIGIAIDKAYIDNINKKIIEIFKDKKINNSDPRIKEITIKDLLTMQSGLHTRDSFLYQWEGLFEMQLSDDWVEYILNLKTKSKAGKYFDYSNMATFMLSAIIAETTGIDTFTFAKDNLFEPLGIKDVYMEANPQGIHQGFARCWMKPHDMAKFGLLYLQKGKWGNQQLISEKWVEESIKAHSFPKQYKFVYGSDGKIDWKTSGANWLVNNFKRPLNDAYGYQWWLDKEGIFSAIGVGGQFIIIAPAKQLIVTITAKMKGLKTFMIVDWVKEYVIPSIVSDEAIVENSEAWMELKKYSNSPEIVNEKTLMNSLPKITKKISGKIYEMDLGLKQNPFQYNNFELDFTENQNYVQLKYSIGWNEVSIKVGLDNIYQFSESYRGKYAARGNWIDENIFEIEYELIGYASKGKWTFKFIDDEMQVLENGVTGKKMFCGKMS